MVFDMHEKLQKKFTDLYCANWILDSIEIDAVNYIKLQLGEDISAKIESIGFDLDGDNFITLTIFVPNKYRKEILRKVKETFPGWDWDMEPNTNFSDIYLRLDDDVVASIPRFMFDE